MSQVHQADDATFDSVVLRHDGAVLVDFGAAWCGPCKKLEPIVHEIAGDFDGRLKVVKVDVDRAPAVAAKYAVLSVPTVLLFRDGQKQDTIVGLVTKKALAERVQKVL
jgi:thioredoxin 1